MVVRWELLGGRGVVGGRGRVRLIWGRGGYTAGRGHTFSHVVLMISAATISACQVRQRPMRNI